MSSPLGDRSVVITRASNQNESLRRMLEAVGADVVEVPLIAIEEPEDEGRERDGVLQRLHEFDWVVVTSPNGAERVSPFLTAAIAADDETRFPFIAVVGAATANTIGVAVNLVAEPARADVLASSFPDGNGRVLVVQGNLADATLGDAIESKGWRVTRVVAYRTVQLQPAPELREPALAADVLLLASGSAASAWFDAFGAETPATVVAIGPSTAKVAAGLGFDVSATAPEQTLASLIETAARVIAAR